MCLNILTVAPLLIDAKRHQSVKYIHLNQSHFSSSFLTPILQENKYMRYTIYAIIDWEIMIVSYDFKLDVLVSEQKGKKGGEFMVFNATFGN